MRGFTVRRICVCGVAVVVAALIGSAVPSTMATAPAAPVAFIVGQGPSSAAATADLGGEGPLTVIVPGGLSPILSPTPVRSSTSPAAPGGYRGQLPKTGGPLAALGAAAVVLIGAGLVLRVMGHARKATVLPRS